MLTIPYIHILPTALISARLASLSHRWVARPVQREPTTGSSGLLQCLCYNSGSGANSIGLSGVSLSQVASFDPAPYEIALTPTSKAQATDVSLPEHSV